MDCRGSVWPWRQLKARSKPGPQIHSWMEVGQAEGPWKDRARGTTCCQALAQSQSLMSICRTEAWAVAPGHPQGSDSRPEKL